MAANAANLTQVLNFKANLNYLKKKIKLTMVDTLT